MNLKTNYEEVCKNIKVLYGDKIYEPHNFSNTTLYDVLEKIKTSEQQKRITDTLRNIPQDKRQEFKKNNLPFFVIGEFQENLRDIPSFITTQYAVFDYDHVGESLNDLWEKIISDDTVFAAFHSPSGDGIKVIYKFDKEITDAKFFSAIYKYYAEKFVIDMGEKLDATSDCSRACFLSYDPDLYFNSDATPLNTDLDIDEITPSSKESDRQDFLDQIQHGVKAGQPRTPVLTSAIGMLLKNGVDREHALAFALGWNQLNEDPHTEEKVSYTVNDIYDRYANQSISEKTKDFYSYETSIYEARMIGDEFSLKIIGEKKFLIKMNVQEKSEKNRYVSHVVKNNDLHTLRRIDYVSDLSISKSFYKYDSSEGIYTAHIAPCKMTLEDNQFIEDYLNKLFGQHTDFIKQWLALYVYTNYKSLPHLILTGGRGTSKTAFVNMITVIFPTLTSWTKELDGNFNPDAEKKLVVIDESDSKGKIQYRTLKKYSGQRFLQVNKKYLPQYQVRNNMNIIILSNDEDAIYVEREEAPTDEKNNQFFVYELKELNYKIDPDFSDKLMDRIGHYARTELKDVFEKINCDGTRYGIPVPITEEEKLLFQNSITEVESDADTLIQQLIIKINEFSFEYKDYVKAGYIPTSFFTDYSVRSPKHKIVRDLQRRKYLTRDKIDKFIQIGGKRPYCYKLGDKWIDELKKVDKKKKVNNKNIPSLFE